MRFNAAFTALVSSATLMGYAYAEEPEANPDATIAIEKPTFTVRDILVNCYHLPDSNCCLAHCSQGPLPRAVHQGLGISVEAFDREEG